MFKIHKKVKYALTALKYIQGKPAKELTTAKEICSAFRIPFDPTSRVLQIMAQHKILTAIQGAYGGYRLEGDLSKLSVYDLSRMLIGPLAVSDCCLTKAPRCERSSACVLKGSMGKLNTRLMNVFKDILVTELI